MRRDLSHEDLRGLEEGWCLFKTDEGWVVGRVSEDCYECHDSVTRLAEASTIPEAIAMAHVEVRRREREDEERRADYARRKAAGELNTWELFSEQHYRIWAPQVLAMVTRKSVVLDVVNRSFEKDLKGGEVITLTTREHKALKVES